MATIFIFHQGSVYPAFETWSRRKQNSVVGGLVLSFTNHVQNGRTQRGREYMERLAEEVFPEFQRKEMIAVGENCELPQMDWKSASEAVLLWPDANGMGWTGIERQVFHNLPPGADVMVANGRRRRFALDRKLWRGIRWRRFLEKSLLLEFGFTLVFTVLTPWFILSDLIRHRN